MASSSSGLSSELAPRGGQFGTTAWIASTVPSLLATSVRTCLVGGGLGCSKNLGSEGETGVVGGLTSLATLMNDSSAPSESVSSV